MGIHIVETVREHVNASSPLLPKGRLAMSVLHENLHSGQVFRLLPGEDKPLPGGMEWEVRSWAVYPKVETVFPFALNGGVAYFPAKSCELTCESRGPS